MPKGIIYMLYSGLIGSWLFYQQVQGSILFEASQRALRNQAIGMARHK
ncbi:MAG TPA: hypothetical protein PKA63_11630 [Oligoflexia bacterium]|nr:hypothetical protein [Oligoflexia bacterium]HMP49304.1 hypothetical protein [Oligoflexia bacterium]